jgi:hypothetical protein
MTQDLRLKPAESYIVYDPAFTNFCYQDNRKRSYFNFDFSALVTILQIYLKEESV